MSFPTEKTMAAAVRAERTSLTSHVFYVAGVEFPNGHRVYVMRAAIIDGKEDIALFTATLRYAALFRSLADFEQELDDCPALRGLSLWAVQCGEQVK